MLSPRILRVYSGSVGREILWDFDRSSEQPVPVMQIINLTCEGTKRNYRCIRK